MNSFLGASTHLHIRSCHWSVHLFFLSHYHSALPCHLAFESRILDNVSSECEISSGRKVMRNYNSSDILRFENMVSRRVINCEIQMDGKREKNGFCACSKRTTFEVIMAPSKRFRPIPWQSFVIYWWNIPTSATQSTHWIQPKVNTIREGREPIEPSYF